MALRDTVFPLFRKYIHYLRHLNLFPSTDPMANQPHQLRNQIISTRLFIFSLLVSLAILLIYTSTVTIDRIRILEQPTLDQYMQLIERHPQSLACPCTHISINHHQFLQLNYSLHQVCSSAFVSEEWQNYLHRIAKIHTNGSLLRRLSIY